MTAGVLGNAFRAVTQLRCSGPHVVAVQQRIAHMAHGLAQRSIFSWSSPPQTSNAVYSMLRRIPGFHDAARPQAAQGGRNLSSESASNPLEVVTVAEPAGGGAGDHAMGWWLLTCCGIVVGMVSLGGVTRLTGSGLSMVKWKPHGERPPITQAEWEEEFEEFKQYPEYQMKRKYENFTLEEFKFIYFMEWSHRMAGRVLGFAFAVPLVYFAAKVAPRFLASSPDIVARSALHSAVNSRVFSKTPPVRFVHHRPLALSAVAARESARISHDAHSYCTVASVGFCPPHPSPCTALTITPWMAST